MTKAVVCGHFEQIRYSNNRLLVIGLGHAITAVKTHNFVFFSDIARKSGEIQRHNRKSGDFVPPPWGETAKGGRRGAKSRDLTGMRS